MTSPAAHTATSSPHTVGVLTPGGIAYHRICWQQRIRLVGDESEAHSA
jgi:hypothetical protein